MTNSKYLYAGTEIGTEKTVTGFINIVPTERSRECVFQIVENDIYNRITHTVHEHSIFRVNEDKEIKLLAEIVNIQSDKIKLLENKIKEIDELENALSVQNDDLVNFEKQMAKISKFQKCNCVNRQKSCNFFMQDYHHGIISCKFDKNEFGICMAKVKHIEFERKQIIDYYRNGDSKLVGFSCGYCHNIIDRYDIFCKHCGIKFK